MAIPHSDCNNNCMTQNTCELPDGPECKPIDEGGIVDFDKKYSLEINELSLPCGVCRAAHDYIAIIYVWNTDSK